MSSVSAAVSMQPLDHGSSGKDDDVLACPKNDSINEPVVVNPLNFS